jgi:hypothetical protein
MSCGRSHLVESLVAGEASPALEAEMRAHLRGCGRCRHELRWLRAEQMLFRQRAGREEVTRLWKGVVRRSGVHRRRTWAEVLAGLAAGALVLWTVEVWPLRGAPTAAEPPFTAVAATAENEASPEALASFDPAECEPAWSRLPAGLGFLCGPARAGLVASR